jgi:hypothetical protein
LLGAGIARVGRNEVGRDGSAGGGANTDDALAVDGGRVELVVVELGEGDVAAFAAVGGGEVYADFPAAERTRGKREVEAVGGLAVGVGSATVAAVDAEGIDVVLSAAKAGGEVLRFGNVIVKIARDAAFPEVEFEANVFALTFAG